MARQEPGDLLGQLDHEPVWIEEVEGPVPPRPVHRAGEELDAEAPEPLGFGIDVVDDEEDLAGRAVLGGARRIRSEARVRSRSPNLVSPVASSA